MFTLSPLLLLGLKILAVVALVAAVFAWDRHRLGVAERAGYDRAVAEGKSAAEAQAERNRELARAAEKRYVVQAEARERVIVTTITEVRDATQHLASVPLGADAVRLLNHAGACASEDRPATCGDDGKVRDPRAPETRSDGAGPVGLDNGLDRGGVVREVEAAGPA